METRQIARKGTFGQVTGARESATGGVPQRGLSRTEMKGQRNPVAF